MTRGLLAVLLCGVVLCTWALAQEPQPPTDKDEPPLRLKKKGTPDDAKPDQPKKPAAEDKKPGDAAKEPETAEPQEDEKEVLNRVAKNMRSLEERLANKELGDGTRQVGDDILKDLESLIRSMENPPSGGGGGESQNDPSGGANDQKNKGGQSGGGGQSSPSGGGKRGGQRKQGGGSQPQPGGGKNGGGQQPGGGGNQPPPDKQPGKNPMGGGQGEKNNDPSGGNKQNNGKAGNDNKDGDLSHNADLYKDIWGHLPEAMRNEMNAYSSDKEMIPKYDALIKKCSRTIAEQSSRKDK
jgi:hypothetical protein